MSLNVQIERAGEFTPELAAGIGLLQPFLSNNRDDSPISEDKLRSIIESPTMEQIVAVESSRIVGAASIKLVNTENDEPTGWLDDFVTHPDTRGKGVADMVADEWENWFRERNVNALYFTSNWQRVAAHKFYLRRGAKIISPPDTKSAVFLYPILQK